MRSLLGAGRRRWLLCALLVAVVAGGLSLPTGDRGAVEAQEYSAYDDPEKTALAFVLSQKGDAEEFQSEFGLDDARMERVRAAVRRENEAIARAYAESEAQGTGASEYNERTRDAIAQTKSTIEGLLGEGQRPRLAQWVDAKFAREDREAAESAVADTQFSADGSRSVRCKVYASYYNAYTNYEVALPHKRLKFRDHHRRVRIRPVADRGRRARAPVKEVGPWNLTDNYWQTRKNRDRWDNLPRCVPQAQAAYFDNYHRGRDGKGRIVRNPAGIDLTLAVAKRMKIKDRIQRRGVVRLYVRYPWVRR